MIKKCWLLSIFIFTTTSIYAAPLQSVNYEKAVQQMQEIGNQLIKKYDRQDGLATLDGFSKLYFDHYEGSGMEIAVAAISPSINIKTENLFTQLIGAASNHTPANEMKKTWATLKIRLTADLNLLQSNHANTFTQAFLQAFSILLREGFEALIIVSTLLTYLRRSQHADKSKVIYYGVGIACFFSIITAGLFASVFKAVGTNREAVEGITMLIAASVLFYVSYWLFAKREAERWQGFIKQKMNKALVSGNFFALGLAAFLAVYREGAETILFYQALIISSKGQTLGILLGFISAIFALLMVYKLMQAASFKIPYRLFFTTTALFLFYMAFYFIGGGVLELQEAGWISITPILGFPFIPVLGIFPAWENLGAQLVFLIPSLSALVWLCFRKV